MFILNLSKRRKKISEISFRHISLLSRITCDNIFRVLDSSTSIISLQRIKTTFEISAVTGLQSSIIFHQADSELVEDQAPVVQTLDSAIHHINHYPVDK